MKILPIVLCSTSLFAASPTIYMAPPSNTARAAAGGNQPPYENKISQAEKSAAAKEASLKGITEMMILSPEGRAKDIKAAIEFLKKRSPTTKPAIKMTDGTILTGIMDVEVMPGGTVLIFQIASLKGVRYRIENIENIDSVETNGT